MLNRLVAVGPTSLHRAAAADREYASQELYAFWLSWLAALPGRVLNRPSPQGLSGPWLERTEWLMLAARAGLPTPAYQGGSRPALSGPARRIIVVGRKALGPAAPREVVAGCGRLARFARTAILGVDFDRAWLFAGATPLPGLRRGGEPMLDLLAAALRRAT